MRLRNYYSYFDVDYETYRECEDGSDCCDDDYCRCGVITNSEVIKHRYCDDSELLNEIKKEYGELSLIDDYSIERLFSINKLYDEKSYSVNTCSGYYGEEIEDISYDCKDFTKVLGLNSDTEKIEFLLEREYGFLIPKYVGCEYKLELIKYSDIIVPPINRVLGETVLGDVVGIFEKVGSKYRIIDGHHRWMKALERSEVLAYVCSA